MKLNLIAPNARYDLAHGIPSVFEKDNDGSYLYRFNIEPEMGMNEDETEETQVGWQCYEIRIWEKPTKHILKKAIIRSFLDETEEFNLVNSYNKHVLEIKVDLDAVENYKDYLTFTEDVDTMLETDFTTEII